MMFYILFITLYQYGWKNRLKCSHEGCLIIMSVATQFYALVVMQEFCQGEMFVFLSIKLLFIARNLILIGSNNSYLLVGLTFVLTFVCNSFWQCEIICRKLRLQESKV